MILEVSQDELMILKDWAFNYAEEYRLEGDQAELLKRILIQLDASPQKSEQIIREACGYMGFSA